MRQSSITTATKFVACAISLFAACGASAAEPVKVETENTMMLFEHDYSALMYVNEDKSRAVICLYGLSRDTRKNYLPPLVMQGLDPKKRYRLRELNTESWRGPHSPLLGKCTDFVAEMEKDAAVPTGEALMKMGLPVSLGSKDYDSAIFELIAE